MTSNTKRGLWLGLFAALAVAAFLSPFASKNPDGLDRVAEDKGFGERGKALISSPLPEYAIPGVRHEGLSTAAAGVIGTILTFGVGYGFSALVTRRNRA